MTCPPQMSPDEPFRLASLRKLNVVDTPLEERFDRITRIARQIANVEIAAISLLEQDRQWFKSIQGLDVEETNRDVSFCGHTILQDGVLVVNDAREDERFANNPLVTGDPHIAFYAGCPIQSVDGMNIGSLCLIDSSPMTLTDDQIESLKDLATLAASVLQSASANAVQAQLIAEMEVARRRAMIDPLTRCWNRSGLKPIISEHLRMAEEGVANVAIVALDLDHFKTINDTYGHDAGDTALKGFARCIRQSIRESDTFGRYGGDEFVAVLASCESTDAALAVVERIRARMTQEPPSYAGAEIGITASIGVRWVGAGERLTIADAMREADEAMYDAKRAGRDCCELVDSSAA